MHEILQGKYLCQMLMKPIMSQLVSRHHQPVSHIKVRVDQNISLMMDHVIVAFQTTDATPEPKIYLEVLNKF